MIHLDTSVLIDAFTGAAASAVPLGQLIERGERLGFSAVALFEWLRGPRRADELAIQEAILPAERAIPLGTAEAVLAAELYRGVSRARGREADFAIAATALIHGAHLWTLNPADFRDVPDLRLFEPPPG